MRRDFISYVRAETLTLTGDHIFVFGPFPSKGFIHSLDVLYGNVTAGTAGNIGLQAVLSASDSADLTTMASGNSILTSSTLISGVPRLVQSMPTDGGLVDFNLPIGEIVDANKRHLVFNINMELILIVSVILSLRVFFDGSDKKTTDGPGQQPAQLGV